MTIGTWAVAALCAGLVGSLGPRIIRALPPSVNADSDTPTYRSIAAVPFLSVWLAISAAVLMTIVGFAVPVSMLPAWILVCGVGVWLAYVDARTSLLPTRIIWPLYGAALLVVGIESWLAGDVSLLVRSVVASVASFAVFWVFWWAGQLWRAGGFGFGDVRFAAPLGLVLGTGDSWAAPVGLYLGILIGGIVGLVLKARGHHDSFALGPSMLVGAVLGPLVSPFFPFFG
jgi:leader peptidase (prepilin peptidase)/N-methyltransferase